MPFGSIGILTKVILPVHEHGTPVHLFVSLISFIKVLQVSEQSCQLDLGFWVCFMVMSWSKWGLPLWFILGQGNHSSSEDKDKG